MLAIRKILFPTDFSEATNHMFPAVLALAQKYGAELHVLHVIVLHADDPYNPAHHFPDVEAAYKQMQAQTSAAMASAFAPEARSPEARSPEARSPVEVRQVQRRDIAAAPAIVRYAAEEDVDLIVIGSHGRRGLRHLLLGSVAEEVVRLAPCPVLTAHHGHALPARIQRLLVPIDFSEHAREALRIACDVAAVNDAELHLLHVLENVMHPAFYRMGATSILDLQPDLAERAEEKLEEWHEAACSSCPATYAAVEGNAARDIVQYAQEHDVDVVVIATHGMTGLEQFFLGSVAEKVVRRTPCPVLVVKPFQRTLRDGGERA